MPFNGSGVFVRLYSWSNDALNNIKIRADRMDNETNGISTALSTCITKDGQTTVTADLPMANFKHTGVGAAAARTQYARTDQVQDGNLNWVDGGGTADAITATYSPAVTTLIDGQECYVRATAANATTTPTFSPNGLTARTIVKNGNVALVAGDIAGDGHELQLRYRLSDTKWELLNPRFILSDGSVTTAKIADSNVTTAKIADSNVTTVKIADSNVTNAKIADTTIAYIKTATAAIADVAAITAGTASKWVDAATLKAWWDALVEAPDFTSSELTVTFSSSQTVAHGLGARPSQIEVWIRFKASTGNYVSGDEILAPTPQVDGSNYYNVAVCIDNGNTTEIRLTCGVGISNVNKTTGAGHLPAAADMRYIVRAWK